MVVTASKLRANIYEYLDLVLDGGAIEIDRRGRRLRIVVADESPPSRLSSAPPLVDLVVGDPADLVELDWSAEWRP